MNYDFKKLSAVEQVSEMSDNANVLIEDNGKIKRASKITASWENLKDKPFHEETTRVCVLDECSFTMGYFGYEMFTTDLANFNVAMKGHVIAGQKYKVVFDGIEYEGTAYEGISDEDEAYVGLGVDYYGHREKKDGMNFGLVFNNLNATLDIICATFDIGENHTIAIYTDISKVQKLDKKFMPNAICETNVEFITLHITDDVCKSVTPEDYERLYNAVSNDIPIFGWIFYEDDVWKGQDIIFEAYIYAPNDDRIYGEGVVIYGYYTDYIVYPDGTVEDY